MKCSLGISSFLEEISSLSHSVVLLYFFALIPEEGFLISPCYSLELCIQMVILLLSSLPFALSYSQLFVRPLRQPCCFFAFLFLGDGLDPCLLPRSDEIGRLQADRAGDWSLPPIQCNKSLFIVLQAHCVSDLTPWIYFSLPLYNCKGFDLSHT